MEPRIINKSAYLLALSMMLSTLAFSQKTLPGKYISEIKGLEWDGLTLDSDSSFTYKFVSELRGRNVYRGLWHLKKDTLFLKVTNPFSDDSLIKKDKIICQKGDSNRIRVFVRDSIPFSLASVFINDSAKAISLNDNQAVLNCKIKKIVIRYSGMRDREFILNTIECNEITVVISDSLWIPRPYLAFSRKYLVRRHGLIPLHDQNKPYKGLYIKQSR
jgi:hypothetical protein